MRRADALALGLAALPLAGLVETLRLGLPALPEALAQPGLSRAMALSFGPGLGATLIATALTALILAASPLGAGLLRRLLPPLIALPHAAFAIGLAFLLAPSGLIARALAPLAGWTHPPDVASLGDPWGLGLMLGLVLKETPFLLFLAHAARGAEIRRMGLVAATLGQAPVERFLRVEWGMIYPRLRLPVLAVLAYGLSGVEMALVLGPGLPPPLAVLAVEAAGRPDLSGAGVAAAMGLIQLALTAAAILAWLGLERLGRAALARIGPGLEPWAAALARAAALVLILVPLASLAILVLQSVAPRWPFPALVPPALGLAGWSTGLGPLAATSLALALAAAGLGVALAVAGLQGGARLGLLVWVPLILPQVAFLPGLARGMLRLDPGAGLATLAGHLTFTLPYAGLVLAGPWAAWNPRLGQVAATLGAGSLRILWRLRLPMLAPVLAAALAVGVAVSTGQYLATLILSGGRLATLTTEAVALASGPDRARAAALALSQALIPALAFALAARVKAFPSARRSPKERP